VALTSAPRHLTAEPVHPAAASCPVDLDAGVRAGISINPDQWSGGGQLRARLTCLGGLGVEPLLTAGVGGNHLSVRPGLRLFYSIWFDTARRWSLTPALGGSLMYFTPVGRFATFCHRYDVDACSGLVSGFELGASAGYSGFGLDAMFGFAELPVLTLAATFSLPVSLPVSQRATTVTR
jgi:hypothetical protein